MNRESFPLQENFDAALDMKRAINRAAKIGRIAHHHGYGLVMKKSSGKKSGIHYFETEQSIEDLREFGAVGAHYEGFVEDGQPPLTRHGSSPLVDDRLAVHDPENFDKVHNGLPVRFI